MSLYLGDNLISGNKPINLGVRNIGEIVASTLPLTDAGFHLLDGSLILGGGIYQGFVDYIAELYNNTKVYNPSAFTVVGSPNITADGIASGFSGSNYLTTSQTISGIWKCTALVNCTNGEEDSFGNGIFSGSNSSTEVFYVGIRNRRLQVHLGNIYNDRPTTPIFENNVNYLFELGFTGTKYYLKINNNEVISVDSTTPLTNVGNIQIGTRAINRSAYFRGSIDLKQFSITVDGVEVFSGSNPANYFTAEALWQQSVTDYGVCGKFVYDSTNNTVRLPKVTGIIEGTTDVTALGDLVEAGLPNITGYVYGVTASGTDFTSGCFSNGGDLGYTRGGGGTNTRGKANFNASRSNPIYGNSNTVQPQTIKVLYYIVIANSTKTEIQSDIDEIATDLNGKADTDLTNVTDTGYIKMAGASMPSGRYINLTLGSSGTTYTAPANGWFCINMSTSAAAQYINMINNTSGFAVESGNPANGNWIRLSLPVLKNDVVTVGYNASEVKLFRFYYAKGSESEAS